MPYCSHCGSQVGEQDAYCTRCGARQPVEIPGRLDAASEAVSDRASCVLCYLPFLGWVVSIIVLASARFREQQIVRFHAFQGLYLFVTWLLVDRVLNPVLHVAIVRPFSHAGGFWMPVYGLGGMLSILELAIIVLSIIMMFRVNEREMLRLPFLSELAEKSL
jgi:uncharacterized membrane protein